MFSARWRLLATAFAFAFFELVPAFFVLLLFAPACEARFGATFFLAAVGAIVRLATLGLADLVVALPFVMAMCGACLHHTSNECTVVHSMIADVFLSP